jgi:hypothetical protein
MLSTAVPSAASRARTPSSMSTGAGASTGTAARGGGSNDKRVPRTGWRFVRLKGFKTTVRLETSHSLARIWVLKPFKSSRSSDWDDGEDEKPRNASEPLDVRVSLPDPDPRPHLISKLFAAIQRRKREP